MASHSHTPHGPCTSTHLAAGSVSYPPHDHDHGIPDFHAEDNNAEANRLHFDGEAQKYDDQPIAVEIAQLQADAILKAYPFEENETAVMDFACGTGLISRNLAPHAKSIVGVDISQGMVDQYNRRVNNQGIPPEEMKAVCVQLNGGLSELEGVKFDVVVCAMAYHHFTDIAAVTRTLAHCLKPGGSLIITDIMKPDSNHQTEDLFPQQYHHIVPHRNAFDEESIRQVFEDVGLRQFKFTKTGSATMHGKDVDFFLAKGTKCDA